MDHGQRKALGAFYTPAPVAWFLVRWALRAAHEALLDPAFGQGVFLEAALSRFQELGGKGRILGIEIDPEAHAQVAHRFPYLELIRGDFLQLGPFTQVDAVVGNPPFIRHHRLTATMQAKGLEQARRAGLNLSKTASSWALFTVHALNFVRPGGRLALVLPSELGHARYARQLLTKLQASFASTWLLTFRKPLFPELSQDTLLLLAEGWGEGPGRMLWKEVPDPKDLDLKLLEEALPLSLEVSRPLTFALLPTATQKLYLDLYRHPQTQQLGELATVHIGYVSGKNSFFHLNSEDLRRWHIPPQAVRPALLKARGIKGLFITPEDVQQGLQTGSCGYLLAPQSAEGLEAYLAFGEARGIHRTFKCRRREPWWRIPGVRAPQALLTSMSHRGPRLAANQAGLVASNTLHAVDLYPLTPLSPEALAALWQTQLTQLSCELEGHPLGGGMLKLEPREAQSVLLAIPPISPGALQQLALRLDLLLRQGQVQEAQRAADRLLIDLGLSACDLQTLEEGLQLLRSRRQSSSSARSTSS